MSRVYISKWVRKVPAWGKLGSVFVYSFLSRSTRILTRFSFPLSNFLLSNCHHNFLRDENGL